MNHEQIRKDANRSRIILNISGSEQLKHKKEKTKQIFDDIENTLHDNYDSLISFLTKKGFSQFKILRNELLTMYKGKGYILKFNPWSLE